MIDLILHKQVKMKTGVLTSMLRTVKNRELAPVADTQTPIGEAERIPDKLPKTPGRKKSWVSRSVNEINV
jgi:hypothetical protein